MYGGKWSKNRYDIANRPDQGEMSKHCRRNQDLEKDLAIFILDNDFDRLDEQERTEDTSASFRLIGQTRKV